MAERGLPPELSPSDAGRLLDTVWATVLVAVTDRDQDGHIRDFTIEYANSSAVDIAGRRASDLVGRSLFELYPALESSGFFGVFVDVMSSGQPAELESAPYRDRLEGRSVWGLFDVRAAALGDRLVLAFRDVTSRQQQQRALDAAQRLAGIGSWVWDAQSDEVWFSPEMYPIFGLDPQTPVTVAAVAELTHPDDRETARDLVANALISDEQFQLEHRLVHDDGSERVILVSGGAVRGNDGDIAAVLGTTQDVTELRRLESELTSARAELLERALEDERRLGHDRLVRSETRYRTLVEALSAIVASSSPEMRITEPSPSWEAYTGQSWSEYQGHGWVGALQPDDLPILRAHWDEARESRRPFSCEARLWHAESERFRHVIVSLAPLLDASGAIAEWIGTVDDIDDRRQLEEARREAELRYRSLADADVLGIVYGEAGRIVEANTAFLQLLGFAPHRLDDGGIAAHEFVPPDRKDEYERLLEAGRRSGTLPVRELDLLADDGRRVPVLLGGAVLASAPFRWVGFVQDLRPQKRAADFANSAAEISDLIVRSTGDQTSTLSLVTERIGRTLGCYCMVACRSDDQVLEPVALADQSGLREDLFEALADERLPAGPIADFESSWSAGVTVATGPEELAELVHPDFRHYLELFGVRSVAFVPIDVQDSILGMVVAARVDESPFSDQERNFLRDLGDRCGLAMSNWRLQHARQRAAKALTAVQGITDATVDVLEVDALLEELLVRLRDALEVDTVRILLAGDDMTLHGGAALGFGADFADERPVPVGQGVAGRIAVSRGPLVIDDLSEYDIVNPVLARRGLTTLAGVPLRVGETLVGVLHVGCEKHHAFDEWDIEILARAGERIAAAIERNRLYEREKAVRERLEFVAAINEVLVVSLDRREIMRSVVRLSVPRLGDWCSIHVTPDDPAGSEPDVEVAHTDPAKVDLANELRRKYPVPPSSPIGVGAVLRTGQPQFFAEFPYEQLEGRLPGDERLDVLRQLQVNSVMIVPLLARGRVIGAMQFVQAESGRNYTSDDLALARSIAGRVASALDNVRLYERQRSIARTLQASLLPASVPELTGAAVAVRYWAAGEATEVGGDFYDVFPLSSGRMGMVIGDVCGKGPQAAAVTGLVRHTLRAAARHEDDPAAVVREVNQSIIDAGQDLFCTAVYGVIERDHEAFGVRLVASGHPLPIVVERSGEVTEAGQHGNPLGIFDEIKAITERTVLRPGDTLVLYTDGITDVPPPHDLDSQAMRKLVSTAATGSTTAEEIADRIFDAVQEIKPLEARDDDIAMLVVRIDDEAPPALTVDLAGAGLEEVPRARRRAVSWLDEHRVPPTASEELAVVVSELLSNAILSGDEHATHLTVHVSESSAVIEVVNNAQLHGPLEPELPDPQASSGRGLFVAAALVDDLDIVVDDDVVRIRAIKYF
jgi:PAS domain S-box-containing protein